MKNKIMEFLKRLADFRKECEDAEYTDTGTLWEFMEEAEGLLAKAQIKLEK